jgi:hypothetical protein
MYIYIYIYFNIQNTHCNSGFQTVSMSFWWWSLRTKTCKGMKNWNKKNFTSHTGQNCFIFYKVFVLGANVHRLLSFPVGRFHSLFLTTDFPLLWNSVKTVQFHRNISVAIQYGQWGCRLHCVKCMGQLLQWKSNVTSTACNDYQFTKFSLWSINLNDLSMVVLISLSEIAYWEFLL